MDLTGTPGLIDRRHQAPQLQPTFLLPEQPTTRPQIARIVGVHEMLRDAGQDDADQPIPVWLTASGCAILAAIALVILGCLIPAVHALTPGWVKVLAPLIGLAGLAHKRGLLDPVVERVSVLRTHA